MILLNKKWAKNSVEFLRLMLLMPLLGVFLMLLSRRKAKVLIGFLRFVLSVLFFVVLFLLACDYFEDKSPLIMKSLRWIFH